MIGAPRKWCILVAEDDDLVAATVHQMLRREGFCITVAEDGQLALEAATNRRFDALLTDLRMPRLDGITLIQRLRADRPALPVIVMSGYAPVDWPSAIEKNGEGPTVVLDKPVRLKVLLNALRRILGAGSGNAAERV
jgi:CheY-like chemotaxis protein